MKVRRTAIEVVVLVAMGLAWYGGYARRPPFCNYYGSADRSPYPRWWLFAPHTDYEGESFRVDHRLNLVLLHVGADFEVILNTGGDQVFDERGNVLLRQSGYMKYISVPNTPDILATTNRLYAFNRAGEWHDFAIPEGFAKDFEEDFLKLPSYRPILAELERFAKQRGLDELSDWVATQR